MSTYEAGSTASAAIALTRRLSSLRPGGPAVEVDPDTFLRATRLGMNPHSEAAILDSVPVVPADDPSAVGAHEQLTAQPTADAPPTGDAFRYHPDQPGPEPITVQSTVSLDGPPEALGDAGPHMLIQLRKTLGRQIIAGRGTSGELRGLLHLQGVQRPEYGNLLAFAVSGAMSRAWDQGGSRPGWAALNVHDSLELLGPQDRRFVSGAAIIRSRVLPRGTFVTGACSPLTVGLRIQSLVVWVDPPSADRNAPIAASVRAELNYLRPSAFVIAKFGKAPVLDPDNMPKIHATPEEWEALDRIIRERRGG
ncbi:MAG: hypothetical protein OXR64_15360 [Chloroflexota bacterium]|nr:hypothetical protein [Chloroflexota bacterium]MDE2921214.1 hypothetical protein [Chloroflexota bacterium]